MLAIVSILTLKYLPFNQRHETFIDVLFDIKRYGQELLLPL